MPRSFMSKEAKWFPEGSLVDMPDIEANRSAFEIRGFELQPGDCVAFNMLTVHGSQGTAPGQRRRVFSLRVTGDDMRHAPRRWITSPQFDGLENELPAGQPLNHPLFPLLYSAQ
jgi:ectoine hydroxylase-related dioxygenase (phytanoyl-CoA dioxygenase family)